MPWHVPRYVMSLHYKIQNHTTFSNGASAAFTRPDPDAFLQGSYEDLSVTYFTSGIRPCRHDDRINRNIYKGLVYGNFKSHFGDQIRNHLGSPVDFLALLLAMARHTANGDSGDLSVNQGFPYLIQFVLAYDGSNQFHGFHFFKSDY